MIHILALLLFALQVALSVIILYTGYQIYERKQVSKNIGIVLITLGTLSLFANVVVGVSVLMNKGVTMSFDDY